MNKEILEPKASQRVKTGHPLQEIGIPSQ
jgi:hypothetical protein